MEATVRIHSKVLTLIQVEEEASAASLVLNKMQQTVKGICRSGDQDGIISIL